MNKKFILPLGILLGTAFCASDAEARFRIVFDDDSSWVDSMMASSQRMFDRMGQYVDQFVPSKEELDAYTAARDKLSKINHTVTDNDSSVTISFKGFVDLKKDNVKVVKKDNGWFGTIVLNEGRIEFFISARGLQVTSRLELKKEQQQAKDKDGKVKTGDKQRVDQYYFTSSSSTQGEFFSSLVNLGTLKAEPVKSNEFTLTVQKQKEEVLPIS